MLVVFEVCQIGTVCDCRYGMLWQRSRVILYQGNEKANMGIRSKTPPMRLASIKNDIARDALVHRRKVDSDRPLRLV
jgi:hypothetical protein